MNIARKLIASILLIFVPAGAHALEGRLQGLGDMAIVFVWKSKKAHDEGLSLINAGVHRSNPALLFPLIACLADTNTRVLITDAGFATHDILVIEGENAGCRGNIPVEAFKR